MAKSKLNARKNQVKHIMDSLRRVPQKAIGAEVGSSQPNVSYRMNNVYPGMIEECIKLFDLAGYEVIEKEEFANEIGDIDSNRIYKSSCRSYGN